MKLRTCPQCGSTDIALDRMMDITGTRYKCNTCGYSGEVIIEQDVEKRFKESFKKLVNDKWLLHRNATGS